MATIRDVAKQARVSIATVSACVNASAPVSPALRRRVEEAVARAGYRPDALARGLKTGITRTLGLAVDRLDDPFAAAVAAAAVRTAQDQGYAVLLAAGGDEGLAGLEARRAEGIVAVTASAGATWRAPRCPAVVVGPAAEGCASVGPDLAQMADAAAEHLADLGHRRIALVIGQDYMPRGEQALEGYRRALARHGTRFEPRLVRAAAPGKAKSGRQDQARDTARALLAAPDWPSAVVVCGAGLALGVMGAMAAAGIACPAGISIMALGDGDWAGQASPALTAVGEPAREIGAEAVRLLLDRLKNGTGPTAGRVLVPGVLVLRASTAPPGAAG